MAAVTFAAVAAGPVPAYPAEADLALAPALPASILFEPGVSDLPDQARPVLDNVAAAMRLDEGIHIMLVAYATGAPGRPMQARHISLVRASYIRLYLMEHSISSERIGVRGLGSESDGGAGDRVDIVVEP
jgi:outer membrane protein OmpA-like peptidoglycan-associated protein